MGKLKPYLPFVTDETPLSWATRMATFHTGGRLVPFLNDMGVNYQEFAKGAPEALMALCEIAGQDVEPVAHNAVRRTGHRTYVFRGTSLSAEDLCSPKTRFCPACLAQDSQSSLSMHAARRYRLDWRFAAVRTCFVHTMPLIDRRSSQWDAMLGELPVLVTETDAELEEQAVQQGERVVSPLQTYVLRRLDGERDHPWLDSMSLELATKVTEKLGAVLEFGTKARPWDLSEDDWDAAGATGWKFTAAGPEGVRNALSMLQRKAMDSGQGGLVKTDIFGMTHAWLSAKRNTKVLEPVRSLFRAHYLATMQAIPGDLIFGEPVKAPQFSSLETIARLEKVDVRTFRNLLIGKGILSKSSLVGGQGVLREQVPYGLGVSAANEMKRSVAAPEGMQMLNAIRPIWKILIEQRYLVPIAEGGEHATVRCKAIDVRQITKLTARLEKLALPVDQIDNHFRTLAKCAEISRLPLTEIIPALLSKRFKTVQRLTSEVGFKAILLDPKEVGQLLERRSNG